MAVLRIMSALVLFHLIMSVLLIGVNSSRNARAGIQNGYVFRARAHTHSPTACFLITMRVFSRPCAVVGPRSYWGPKFVIWAVLTVLAFLIPNNFYHGYGVSFAGRGGRAVPASGRGGRAGARNVRD